MEEREGRWAQLGGRPTSPWAPPPSGFDVALSHWFTMAVQGVPCTIPGRGEGGSPLYIGGEGLHFNHPRNPSNQENPSICSSSPLVEVLGLEEFRFEL